MHLHSVTSPIPVYDCCGGSSFGNCEMQTNVMSCMQKQQVAANGFLSVHQRRCDAIEAVAEVRLRA